jgi:hypothetical protein
VNSDFEMQVWWRTRVSDCSNYVPSFYTLASAEIHAWGIQMTIEGKNPPAIPKSVLNDDNAFIDSPTIWLGVGKLAMSDAVDRLAEARCTVSPVLSRMEPVEAISKSSEVSPSRGGRGMGSIQRKIENVYVAARRTGLADRITKKRPPRLP